jgi:hypothetical protein
MAIAKDYAKRWADDGQPGSFWRGDVKRKILPPELEARTALDATHFRNSAAQIGSRLRFRPDDPNYRLSDRDRDRHRVGKT